MKENERIKYLRKEILHMTQEKFAARLGVKKTAISMIESGDRGVTDQMKTSICREYNVNEEWLRDEHGTIFRPDPQDELQALQAKYDLSEMEMSVVRRFVKLSASERKVILEYMESVAEDMQEHGAETRRTPKQASEMTDAEIDAASKEYADQLRLERRQAGESSASQKDA